MKLITSLAIAAAVALGTQAASAATITYTIEADVLSTNNAPSTLLISVVGDTDNVAPVLPGDARILNPVTGSLTVVGTEYDFTEDVFMFRSGGTVGFVADIGPSGTPATLISFSGGGIPVFYDLASNISAPNADPGIATGAFSLEGGLTGILTGLQQNRTVSFTAVVDAPVSTVPLPASLPLMLAGLGLVGVTARRKRG